MTRTWAAPTLTAVIINYFADEFKKENGIDITDDNAAMQRLRDKAEKPKIELSTAQK